MWQPVALEEFCAKQRLVGAEEFREGRLVVRRKQGDPRCGDRFVIDRGPSMMRGESANCRAHGIEGSRQGVRVQIQPREAEMIAVMKLLERQRTILKRGEEGCV